MNDVVTRLVIRADGALLALDSFEKGMEEAGKATDYTTGAVADFEKRMEVARQAIERGNAISVQSVARKSQEERAWEKWSATIDRTAALRIRLERESMQASVAASNAVNAGYVSQEQALNQLMALERRHAQLLSTHIASENNVAVAYNRTAEAADRAAISTSRLNAANSNRGMEPGAFNTANVAAQFQDVGVTAAMGMSPIMIALQQGTQLSAALGGQGLTGVVRTLGAAFASILSPVSLLTIGVVALAAWGIQAFMGIANQGEAATRSLEDHKKWLDDLLVGYDAVSQAADRAAKSSQRMPEGVVRSDLRANLLEQEIASEALQTRIQSARTQIEETAQFLRQTVDIGRSVGDSTSAIDAGLAQIEQIQQLGLSSKNTAAELDQVMVAAIELYRSIDDPAVQAMAKSFYDLALELRGVQTQAASTQAALAALANMDIQIKVQASTDEALSAIERIARFAPELRSIRQQAQDELNTALGAPDAIVRQAAQRQYEQTIAALDEQDRRREAEAAARKSASTGLKTIDQWGKNVDQFEERLASQRLEIDLLGQSSYEIARQRAEFELLNQAKQAGIDVSTKLANSEQTVAEWIGQASSEAANLTVEMERLQAQSGLALSINNALASGFSNMFIGLINGSKSAEEAIGELLASLGQLLINQAFMGLLGGGTSGGIGGALAGLFFNAKGNVYSSPSLSAYSNRIYDTPQLFAFAKGAGVFGEAGPEAIMPLGRTSSGDLGVRVANNNHSAANQNAWSGDMNFYANVSANSETEGAAAARGFQAEMKRWQKSGEGHAFVRDAMKKMGRAN